VNGTYEAAVIGASAGGGRALEEILKLLPPDYALPVLVVQHLHPTDYGRFAEQLSGKIRRNVTSPCDKQTIEPGFIYVAPPDYHMLVEKSRTIALSVDEKVRWSRPSIDVLFDSAARVWKQGLIATILSGANNDGAEGMRIVKSFHGYTMVQDPSTAEHPFMPESAIALGVVDEVLTVRQIAGRLAELGRQGRVT
jgi:two-component system chemotaxis response regulator CheB